MHIEDLPAQIDLGHDHTLRFTANAHGKVLGGIMCHPAKADRVVGLRRIVAVGDTCAGTIWLSVPELLAHAADYPGQYQVWTVESWNPISLEPSLRCDCGDFGKVVEGEWVPA